jgi:hypothetical protein
MGVPTREEMDEDLLAVRGRLLTTVGRDRFWRRWQLLAAGGVLVVAAGAATAGIVISQAPKESTDYSVVCYERADLSSREAWFGVPQETVAENGEVRPRERASAEAMCALAWRGGLLGQDAGPPADPNSASLPVPPLAYCLRNDGITAGFPRGDESESALCDRLGLRVSTS